MQRRNIHSKISLSPQLNKVSIFSRLLFTWMISQADDVGLIPYDIKIIKSIVFPLDKSITDKEIDDGIKELIKTKDNKEIPLIDVYKRGKDTFLLFPNFLKYQTIKTDRNPQTYLGPMTWTQVRQLSFVKKRNINKEKTVKKEISPEQRKLWEDSVELIKYWARCFLRTTGKAPILGSWNRHIYICKKYIKTVGLDEMKNICDSFFESNDKFIVENNYGLNIFLLDNTLNKFNK